MLRRDGEENLLELAERIVDSLTSALFHQRLLQLKCVEYFFLFSLLLTFLSEGKSCCVGDGERDSSKERSGECDIFFLLQGSLS